MNSKDKIETDRRAVESCRKKSLIKSRAATALPRKKISTYLRLSEDII